MAKVNTFLDLKSTIDAAQLSDLDTPMFTSPLISFIRTVRRPSVPEVSQRDSNCPSKYPIPNRCSPRAELDGMHDSAMLIGARNAVSLKQRRQEMT